MRKKYLITAGIIAVILFYIIYKSVFNHPDVNVIKLSRGNLVTVVYATGNITADTIATLRSEAGGIVKMINTLEGSSVKKGQLLLKTDQADWLLNVRQAESDLKTAQVELANEKINYDRKKNLKETNTISQNEFDNAQKNYELAVLKVEQQKILLDKAKENLSKTEIYAPFSGVIISSDVNLGDNLAPNTVCFRIVSPTSVLVEGDVDEQDLSKISLNQKSKIALDAFPDDKFDAYVYRIVPEINEATKTSKVYLKFVKRPDNLNVGMTATVNIETGKKQDVLLIPRSAVLNEGDNSFIYKINNDVLKKVNITTGTSSGGNYTYLIKGDLKSGDLIAETPLEKWKDGLKVNPVIK